MTAFSIVAAEGDVDMMRLLAQLGCSVDAVTVGGVHTPLMAAASAGNATRARVLVDLGAGVHLHGKVSALCVCVCVCVRVCAVCLCGRGAEVALTVFVE